MNKVITINLGGNAYQLEEGGYNALRAYLETAAARLAGNPDRDEILSDIERAIGEKFRGLLKQNKNVVEEKEVAAVLNEMGPIEAPDEQATGSSAGTGAGSEAGPQAKPGTTPGNPPPRRLYRISEGAMLAGVCNGIGAYFNVDPTFIRLGFVIAFLVWGAGLLIYIVLAFVVPEARSPEEKAAASGIPGTAQEFIRRAKEGYYQGMKNFPDRNARREWRRKFKSDMRANAEQWRQNWSSYWAERRPVHSGMRVALPFVSLLTGLATVLFICTLISVLATDSVFGRPLPGGFPNWGVVIVLVLLYEVVTEPLKRARRACYASTGQHGYFSSFFFMLDAAVWIAVVIALICLAAHFFPEVHDAINSFPKMVREGAHDISDWWNQR